MSAMLTDLNLVNECYTLHAISVRQELQHRRGRIKIRFVNYLVVNPAKYLRR